MNYSGFLQGDTNIQYLKDNGVTIWNEWADENGDLGLFMVLNGGVGHVNGKSIDQIKNLIDGIKHNPDSRRLLFQPGM